MYVKKGEMLAKENNYEEAYNAFRRAYSFDPTNELAKSEMDRMVRLQKDLSDPAAGDKGGKKDLNGQYTPANYVPVNAPVNQLPQKLEKLRDLPFPSGIDLQFIIKELTRELDLNVLFDSVSFRTPGRKTYIDLKNVTAAKALDYIFLQEGLFFQKVGPRTILVANQEQRQKFQQLVLRTFYLSNAAPKDVAKVIQTAIPAQPGRTQTIVLTDDATNSVTVRDTEENVKLIGKLIGSLDKDRAEVVMDVAIYEVNKSDLLQLGNQIGTAAELQNLGGTNRGLVKLNSNPLLAAAVAGGASIPTAFATGILLPSSHLSLYSSKQNTKLVASTQIHAFNNEDSSARIGQRVPVRSAQFVTGTTGTIGNNGVVSDVINYEQVGLTLKFKPLVFPNQDVQVAMEIESKDVAGATGTEGTNLNPTFIERTIKGTARIQNNKTLLLASVATSNESKGQSGLPLVGLIPIIGRLFNTPGRDNHNVDIVIAVTPRVIRAPAILPEDEIERPTGSLAVPTNNSLEAMVIQEDREEQLALARKIPNAAEVQLPDQTTPVYVRSETAANTNAPAQAANSSTVAANSTTEASKPIAKTADLTTAAITPAVTSPSVNLKPIDTNVKTIDNSVKTLQLNQTSDTVKVPAETQIQPATGGQAAEKADPSAAPNVQVSFGQDVVATMKAGEKVKIPIIIQASAPFRSGVVGIAFDAKKMAVRSVSFGDVFGTTLANTTTTPFINQNGKMYVTLTAKDDAGAKAGGTLAFIEIEALMDGRPEITFDRDVLNFLTADGKNFQIK